MPHNRKSPRRLGGSEAKRHKLFSSRDLPRRAPNSPGFMPSSPEPAPRGARHAFPRFWLAFLATIIVAGGAALVAVAILGVGEAFSLLSRLPAPTLETAAVSAIFAATYLVLAVGKLPYYRLDRAGGALLGASLMIGVGALTLDEAYRAIDFDAITLLLGMMIVVANLRLSGFFRRAADWLADVARRPIILLVAVASVTGFFSAFLVNDAICLVMPPLIVDLTLRLKRDPTPYVLAIPLASNVGSVATITGNPQNMIIAGASKLSYGEFAQALWPIALGGVALTVVLVALAFPKEFFSREKLAPIAPKARPYHAAIASKALLITAAMIAFFFMGVPPAKVAIVAGGLLLLTRRIGSGRADAGRGRRDRPAAPRPGADARAGFRRAFQCGQQCAGGSCAEALRCATERSKARVAHRRHGFDARRQFHPCWFDRQSHRRRARAVAWRENRLLDLFQGRRAADLGDDRAGPVEVVRDYASSSRSSAARPEMRWRACSRLIFRLRSACRTRAASLDGCSNLRNSSRFSWIEAMT